MQVIDVPISHLSHFECTQCHQEFDGDEFVTFCDQCNSPIIAQYGFLSGIGRNEFHSDLPGMWKYFRLLPLKSPGDIVTLGEGDTPMLSLNKMADHIGLNQLYIKDESLNPTGSFKARGLSMAVSMAKQHGIDHCVIPTAGNAGGALSAYCARGGLKATVVMPRQTPDIFKKECVYFDAHVVEIDGFIDDCGQHVRQICRDLGGFDVSTLKEPFRLEGKKTMGYEIAEQFDYNLPDAIIYPTGGGTGLIGIWKAFQELSEMGMIEGPLPKMIAVQSVSCQPIVRAYKQVTYSVNERAVTSSIANGLVVPSPFAKDLILDVIEESKGYAMAVSDEEMLKGVKDLARLEGMFAAPESGALIGALRTLTKEGVLEADDSTLLINTGSGYKYAENLP